MSLERIHDIVFSFIDECKKLFYKWVANELTSEDFNKLQEKFYTIEQYEDALFERLKKLGLQPNGEVDISENCNPENNRPLTCAESLKCLEDALKKADKEISDTSLSKKARLETLWKYHKALEQYDEEWWKNIGECLKNQQQKRSLANLLSEYLS